MRSYFPEADAAFLKQTGFANPVGQNFQQATTELVNGLSDEVDLAELKLPLDRIVRILTVQGLPAGMSIRFLSVLRRQLESEKDLPAEEKIRWVDRIDALTEMAVEIGQDCRETLSLLRISELRQRIRQLEAASTPNDRGGIT